MMCRIASLLVLGAACAAAAGPELPKEYSAVIQMKMPYLSLEMPLRVLTSAATQKIEYYNGLQVDVSNARGTFKYAFNNSRRVCMYTPAQAGPTSGGESPAAAVRGEELAGRSFFPDLSQYTYQGDELVGGIMCQKFALDVRHGSLGTMDDHISFYWDPILSKPVRWHMHSRHVTFGSHTDEYIMDYLSFQAGAPAEADLELPAGCQQPQAANVSIQIKSFLAAAGATRTVAQKGDAVPLLFGTFLRQYGKSYAPGEHARRQAIFERNLKLVKQLNDRHAGRASFRGNQFLDMSPEEVMRFRGGKAKGASLSERRLPEHSQFVRVHEASAAAELPKNFDWRTARPGSVSPVKDQAMCGSCWTYGLTEPIESIQAIRTGRLVELSEQFVVDCTWTNGTAGANSGCDGGNSDVGALEIIRKFGGVIPSAAAYGSYLSVDGFCKDTRLMEVGAKITGWVDVKKRDEPGLLQALVSQGPISVGIMVPEEMLFYDSGVLKVESCKHDEGQIDHAVVLTGFGTDEHGTDYYTIRNSWSTYWGDQGYIKVARGEQDCCISCEAGFPELDAESLAATAVVV